MQGSPADARIAAARRLIDRRRYREALDVINDAIRIDPGKSDSFHLRAVVFEYLGMFPQAEADRNRAADLGYVAPPEPAFAPEPEAEPATPVSPPPELEPEAPAEILTDEIVPSTAEEPAEAEIEEPEPEQAAEELSVVGSDAYEEVAETGRTPRVVPVPRSAVRAAGADSGSGGGVDSNAFARGFGTILVSVGLVAAFAVGVYLALASISDALDGGDGGDSDASATPSASGEATTEPTSAAPDDALTGSPISFTNLEAAWDSKGITATPGEINANITGFAVQPVNTTLSRGGEEMLVAILLYDSAQGISQDWDLGDRPTPKAGREIPPDSTVWYNLNAVIIVLESNDALRQDALDGFLSVNA